jgi:hypothetical protein
MTVLVPAEPSFIPQAKHQPASLYHAAQAATAASPSRDETPGHER